MKIVAIIPPRAGSKGILGKNITLLAQKPMICYSIDQAKKSKYINKIIVSSDGNEILDISKKCGAECIKRPKELAGDNSKIDETIKHVLSELEKSGEVFDLVVLLQPTSPLRKSETIDKAIELFIKNKDNFDSLMPLAKALNKIGIIENNKFIPKYSAGVQRQEMEELYYDCGTIHIFKPEIINTGNFFGDRIFAFKINHPESIDIDSQDDIELAEFYIQKYAN